MHHDPELMSAVHALSGPAGRTRDPRAGACPRTRRDRCRGRYSVAVRRPARDGVAPRLVMGEPIDATFVARVVDEVFFSPPPTSPVLSHQPRTRHRRESPDVPRQHSRGEHGTQPERGVENDHGHRHLGIALTIITAAQLMIVLDASVVNMALPSIQTDLGFSSANLPWVINAYVVAFGGLLLLGGRAGDLLGRRRMFMAGIGLFTLASLLGGMAQGEAWLLGAGPAGNRRRHRRANRPGADRRRFLRDHTQPRLRRLRRNVRGGRRGRPHSGRCAHRGVVAVDAVHQHPDRHPAHLVGAPIPWRVRAAARSLRPAWRWWEPAVWSRWSTALPTPPRTSGHHRRRSRSSSPASAYS